MATAQSVSKSEVEQLQLLPLAPAPVESHTRAYRANELVRGQLKLSLDAQRVMYLVAAAFSEFADETEVYVRLDEDVLRQGYKGWEETGRLGTKMYSVAKELRRVEVSYLDVDDRTGDAKFFTVNTPFPTCVWHNKSFYIKVDPLVRRYFIGRSLIVNGASNYTVNTINDIARLRSAYHCRLFDLLKSYVSQGEMIVRNGHSDPNVMDIDGFKLQLGIPVNKYTRPYDFKMNVLEVAKKAINKTKGPISFDYEVLYRGKKNIIGFHFIIYNNVDRLTGERLDVFDTLQEKGLSETGAFDLVMNWDLPIIRKAVWLYDRIGVENGSPLDPGWIVKRVRDGVLRHPLLAQYKENVVYKEEVNRRRVRYFKRFLSLSEHQQNAMVLLFTQEMKGGHFSDATREVFEMEGPSSIFSQHPSVWISFIDFVVSCPDFADDFEDIIYKQRLETRRKRRQANAIRTKRMAIEAES